MYKAIVKWNGNHYFSGEEVRGSKIRTNEDGTVELFDDEPIEEFPFYGDGRDEWVEVKPESIVDLDNVCYAIFNKENGSVDIDLPTFKTEEEAEAYIEAELNGDFGTYDTWKEFN